MSVKRRILAIQLAEKIQQNPEYAKKIGVSVEVKHQQIQKKKKINNAYRLNSANHNIL